MKEILTVLMLSLVGAVHAGGPVADKATIKDARAALHADKEKLKQVTLEQHKKLVLVLEREKADLKMIKASASQPETMHVSIHDIHEKSRRERLALRAQGREERGRLRRAIQSEREQIAAFRQKK